MSGFSLGLRALLIAVVLGAPPASGQRVREGSVVDRSAGGSETPVERLIRFDLGPADARAPGAWNHLTRAETGGLVVKNAVDATGLRTCLAIRQLDAWSGVNRDGARKGTPWSPDATGDSLYLGDHGDRRAALRFEHLVPGDAYDLVLYASRVGNARPRTTRYRAGGRVAALDPQDNTIRCVEIAGARADDRGRLVLEVTIDEKQDYGYLGVIELRGRVGDVGTRREYPLADHEPPATTALGWAIADGRTGKVLHGRFSDTPFEIASTTKIMTALVVLALADKEPGLLDSVATVSAAADSTRGSASHVRVGDRLTVRDLLYGLLLPSGNDAAVALAEHLGGRLPVGPSGARPVARFVDEMNRRARNLGMTQTRYLDPHGNSKNRASASDLVRLAWTALQDDQFRKIVATRRHTATVTSKDDRRRELHWRNTNRLLGLAGCIGVKTGTTRTAGACLVASVVDGTDHHLIVVLGSAGDEARYVDAKNLLRWVRTANAGGR